MDNFDILSILGLILDISGVCCLFYGSLAWERRGDRAGLKEGITMDQGLTKPVSKLYRDRIGLALLITGFSLQLLAYVI